MSDREGSRRTRAEPPFCIIGDPSEILNQRAQNGSVCRWVGPALPVMPEIA
jgi:hypothetical protein